MHRALRHLSSLLIIIYLFIPVMGFAHVGDQGVAATEIRSIGAVAGAPCGHCPCGDEQGSHCCDTGCCSCAFHSPPVEVLQPGYAPVVVIARHTESFRMLPQVYLSIFVPPQNQPLYCFFDIIEDQYPLTPSAVV
jgi:hypothetical protein